MTLLHVLYKSLSCAHVCVCVLFFPQKRHPWPSYPMLTRKFAVRTGRTCANQDYAMIGGSPVPGQWMRSWREAHTFQADFLMFCPSNSLRMQVDDSKWHVCLHTVWSVWTLFVQQRPRKPVCGQDARLVLAEFWVPLRVAAGAPEGAKTWGQLCVSCIGAQMRLQNHCVVLGWLINATGVQNANPCSAGSMVQSQSLIILVDPFVIVHFSLPLSRQGTTHCNHLLKYLQFYIYNLSYIYIIIYL